MSEPIALRNGAIAPVRDLARRRVHGGAAPAGMLDFSVNLNPLGPPDSLSLASSAEHLMAYPEPDSATLRRALAERHGVETEEVLVTNGACEAIELLMASLEPRRVIVLTPAFTEYEDSAKIWGHEVVTVSAREEEGFCWDFAKLTRRLDLGPEDLVVLGNPANPTGVLSELPELNATLLVDETFLDFVESPVSAIGRPRTLVIRSFTKLFACPGLRLGYIVGNVAALRLRQPAWSVSRLAQVIGQALLGEKDYQQFTRQFVAQCRADLTAGLQTVPGLQVFPSTANFLLLSIAHANEIAGRLFDRGIVVRGCDNFSGLAPDTYLRVAVRKRSENQRLIEALHAAR